MMRAGGKGGTPPSSHTYSYSSQSQSQKEVHTSSRAAAPSNTSSTHPWGGVLCVCPCVPRLHSKWDKQFPKPKRLLCTYAHAEMAASLALTALSGTAGATMCGRSGLAAGGRAPASSVSATRLHSHAVRSNASPSSKVRTRVRPYLPSAHSNPLARSSPFTPLAVGCDDEVVDASRTHANKRGTKIVGTLYNNIWINLTFFFSLKTTSSNPHSVLPLSPRHNTPHHYVPYDAWYRNE